MKLRSALAIAASVLLLGLPTWAAPPAPSTAGQHHPKGKMRQALQELNLSQEQRARIKTLMKTTPKGQRRAAVMQVLTPAQQTQFQTRFPMKKQHRTHRPKSQPKYQPGQTNPKSGGNEGPEDD